MKRLVLAIAFVFSMPSQALLFSTSAEPGSGTLTYQKGEKSETIQFGQEHGNYLLGVALNRKLLPEPVKSDFKSNQVLQVTMGPIKKGAPNSAPFGALTLLIDKMPKSKVTYKLRIPEGKEKALSNVGLLMFSSPGLGEVKNDEEKLKQTYFGSAGTLTLTPIGISKLQKLDVSGGKSVSFRALKVKGDIKTELNTPFNPQTHQLTGTVEFLVYWPEGKEAESIARNLAREMLPQASKSTP